MDDAGGPRPDFLKQHVAYDVTGKEAWHYADTLQGVTREMRPFYLDSVVGRANDAFASGSMGVAVAHGEPDSYRSDPADLSSGELDDMAPGAIELIYHSAGFAQDTEVSGSFRFEAWLAIDQPDTDFQVSVWDIASDGGSVFLSSDSIRARYREDPRRAELVTDHGPLHYTFDQFTFNSRVIAKGHRLRVVIAPINFSGAEKNRNSGGVVADETAKDNRPVVVKLFHDAAHPTALYVPIAQPEKAAQAQPAGS
jgi:predicted acyl esterase